MILEADKKFGSTSEMLRKLTIKAANGTMIPLDSVAHVVIKPSALSVSHIGQLPAVTVSYNLRQGVALGEAVDRIQAAVAELEPAGDHPDELPGRGAAVPVDLGQHGAPALRRDPRRLHRARHPL